MHSRVLVVAVGSAVMFFGACGGTGSSLSEHAAPRARAHTLAVKSDGTFDAARVDLSGVPGVSAAEQRRAGELLRGTIRSTEKWRDVARAKADGFTSIGDGFSGNEHFVHWDWIEDGRELDPSRPESLVYRVEPDGRRVLEAAMYIMSRRYTLSTVPDVGGNLTQFHTHANLCFTDSSHPRFVRMTWTGACHAPLVKELVSPMIHVWIRPNPCGPFALIGGFARGSLKEGVHAFCDRVHGSSSEP